MGSITSDLRSEIVESEKARIDLLKWKIILVAGLGSVGFGIAKESMGLPAVLGFIPLVSAYVDVICVHNDLRILVIASFLRTHDTGAAADYERLCLQQGWSFFLESFALLGATLVFSAVVGAVAWFDLTALLPGASMSGEVATFLTTTSVLGAAVSLGAMLFKQLRVTSLAANEAARAQAAADARRGG